MTSASLGTVQNLASDNVKKGYEVVMARGQHEIDLTDTKLFNFLLHYAYTKLNQKTVHTMPASEALAYLNHTSIDRLAASLKRLSDVKIQIDYRQDGVDHTVSCHFLSFKFSKAEDGVITFAFDQILLNFLWEPKVYAKINMEFMQKFKSQYGARLYEIMAFYQHRFHRTWSVSVEDLRTHLGVPDNRYPRFDNLKKYVLDKAVAEVNAIAPFGLDVDYVRGGRGGKVVEVTFTISARSEFGALGHEQSGRKKTDRDPDTVDILDGQTDNERAAEIVLSEETLTEARSMLERAGMDVEDASTMADDWAETVRGFSITDPDLNFLRWVNFQISKSNEQAMSQIDDETFNMLLEDFE